MILDDSAPKSVQILYYCTKCNGLIKPAGQQGIKDGEKHFCNECAAAMPAARPSHRNLQAAASGAAGAHANARDARQPSTAAPGQPVGAPVLARSKVPLIAGGVALVLLCTLALWLILRSDTPGGETDQGLSSEQTALKPELPPSPPPPDPRTSDPPTPPGKPVEPPVTPPVGGNPPAKPVQAPKPKLVSAPVAWQDVRDVSGDADVATNGKVVRAYTFSTGNTPVVNGVAFTNFAAQSLDTQTFGGGYKEFYRNPALSDPYNKLLAGGYQDAAHADTPFPQRLILNGLTPGRPYQVQIWVADNRSWSQFDPAFASMAQTIQASDTDTNVPTLRWQCGPAGPTAQFVMGTFKAQKTYQTLTFTPSAGFFKGKSWLSCQINALILSDLSAKDPRELLVAFKKDMDAVPVLVSKERYTAAGDLLKKLQDGASNLPWWNEQEPRWKEAHQKLQQLIQEGREEADAARAEAEKAATPAALEVIERQWRPRRGAAPAGELTAEWAQNVLDAVEASRRGLRERQREKSSAQLEEKLPALEKAMQGVSRLSDAQQKALSELESIAVQNVTLVDRFGERLAALRWLAGASQAEDLAFYRASLRKIGAASEVSFDFSGREQLVEWELDDPEKHGRYELLVPGPGLLVETKHHHEWIGKDRRNTPILRVPFLVRAERWVAEVDVELVSRTGDRPYQGCLTVWDGGQFHATLMLEETGAKGWHPILFGCTPNREALQARATVPLSARPGESVRLQMACVSDALVCTARFRGNAMTVAKERLGFQPKYLGLMARTCGDMTVVVNFRDLKLIGVSDTDKLKVLRENRKPAEQKQIVGGLRARSRAAERVADGTSSPIPLGAAARVACSSRLKDNRSDDERLILPNWGLLSVNGIPFQVTDPQGATVPNAILLKGEGLVPSKMPESVKVPCGRAAGSVSLLSGVSVGGFPSGEKGSHTLTMRIVHEDGQTEEHLFRNGQHFADYARLVDVPDSKLAFEHQGHQIRCISVAPKRPEAVIKELEFVKGSDGCAPLILGVTLNARPPLPKLHNLGFKDQPVAPGRLGKALSCDGSRGLHVPHCDELEPEEFTVMAWLQMEQYPGDGRRWIAGKNVHEGHKGNYGLLIDNERVMGYLHSDRIYDPKAGRLELKRWEHIALTVSRDRMALYLNGECVIEERIGQPRPKNSGGFAIGVRPDDWKPFRGLIDDVRVYNRVVPPDEMKLQAANPENAPRDGLIAYWSFDEE